MAQLTITVDNTQVTRIQTAFGVVYGYSATLPDGSPNPMTITEFVRQQLIAFIKRTVRSYEVSQAEISARQSAGSAVDAQITPT